MRSNHKEEAGRKCQVDAPFFFQLKIYTTKKTGTTWQFLDALTEGYERTPIYQDWVGQPLDGAGQPKLYVVAGGFVRGLLEGMVLL